MRICRIVFCCFLVLLGCSGKERKSTYTIGIDPSWYPLQTAGQERNVLAFSIELLTTIAKIENLQLSIQTMSWDNLLWGLRQKEYIAVLSPLRPYTFYRKLYTFSDLYLLSGPVLIAKNDSKIANPNRLQGKEIAVVRGSSAALLLQTKPGVLLQGYDSIPEALLSVANGQVDGAAVDILIAQRFLRDLYSDTLKIIGVPLNDEGLRIITLHDQAPGLIQRFDRGLATLKKNGDYHRLLSKWGLSPDGQPTAHLEQELQRVLYHSQKIKTRKAERFPGRRKLGQRS